jgi:hypothetical protein
MKKEIYLDFNVGDIIDGHGKVVSLRAEQPHVVFEFEDGHRISKRGMEKIYEKEEARS